ncbi:unnamed protein product [[Candida] boidinii]|nr:unnamed protein product [[Candida] boidinii]
MSLVMPDNERYLREQLAQHQQLIAQQQVMLQQHQQLQQQQQQQQHQTDQGQPQNRIQHQRNISGGSTNFIPLTPGMLPISSVGDVFTGSVGPEDPAEYISNVNYNNQQN